MFRPKSFQEHFDEPDISIDQHADLRARELGRMLRSRQAVYLDTCYWVYMKNGLGGGRADKSLELLESLRDKAAAGLVFCPISDSIFVELMKQTDPISRSATADLINELSLGVTLLSEQERVQMEVQRFVRTAAGQSNSPPLYDAVWCKLAYVMGIVHPYNTGFDPGAELAIQKAFFDHMWGRPLSQIVEAMANVDMPGSDWSELARQLNEANTTHADSLRSYRQAYKAEVRGAVDLIGDVAFDTFMEVAAEMGPPAGQMTAELREVTESFWKNVIATKLEKGAAQSQLPSLHIIASLHASLRWNRQQKLDSHDIFDFQHATAALAYCDAFFTERPLSNMIKQNHLRLDRELDCFVTSDVGEALAWVEQVSAG